MIDKQEKFRLLNILNENGIDALLQHVIGDVSRCTICEKWSLTLKKAPHELIRHLGNKNDLFSFGRLFNAIGDNRYIEICDSCEESAKLNLATHRRRLEDIKNGHLSYSPYLAGTSDRYRFGKYVYMCEVRDGIYKIGATKNNPLKRMQQQGIRSEKFRCAIESDSAFALEACLHSLFSEKLTDRSYSKEIFKLDNDDVEYIKSLKTFNKKPLTIYTQLSAIV